MNANKVCLNCGSTSFVSDRSLGGRLICSKCSCTSFRTKSFSQFHKKKNVFIVIGLIVFLIIIVI